MSEFNIKKKKIDIGFVISIVVIVLSLVCSIFFMSKILENKEEELSGDEAVCNKLNSIIENYDASITNINNAIKTLDSYGYLVENMSPTSKGNYYVYNAKKNRFALISSTGEDYNVLFGKLDRKKYNNWIIVNNRSDIINSPDFSHYLSNHYSDDSDSITISSGFDVGNYKGYSSIVYDNNGGSKKVTIRYNMNNCELTVNNKYDEITRLSSD